MDVPVFSFGDTNSPFLTHQGLDSGALSWNDTNLPPSRGVPSGSKLSGKEGEAQLFLHPELLKEVPDVDRDIHWLLISNSKTWKVQNTLNGQVHSQSDTTGGTKKKRVSDFCIDKGLKV